MRQDTECAGGALSFGDFYEKSDDGRDRRRDADELNQVHVCFPFVRDVRVSRDTGANDVHPVPVRPSSGFPGRNVADHVSPERRSGHRARPVGAGATERSNSQRACRYDARWDFSLRCAAGRRSDKKVGTLIGCSGRRRNDRADDVARATTNRHRPSLARHTVVTATRMSRPGHHTYSPCRGCIYILLRRR